MAENQTSFVSLNVYLKEQFLKEIVEQVQQKQVQAEQVIKNRKGMNKSCLRDPRYFSQIKSQKKSTRVHKF